jgi:hypothetical protein
LRSKTRTFSTLVPVNLAIAAGVCFVASFFQGRDDLASFIGFTDLVGVTQGSTIGQRRTAWQSRFPRYRVLDQVSFALL